MNIPFPEYKIGDDVWFLSKQDILVYGDIETVNLIMRKDESSVWYSIQGDDKKFYVISEKDIIKHNELVKKPKYQIGDEIVYQFYDVNDNLCKDCDVIETIEFYSDCDTFEVMYTCEKDKNYYIKENEILYRAESLVFQDIAVEARGGGYDE